MKKSLELATVLICFTLWATAGRAATVYWDIDGAIAGAGGPTPAGTWDAATTTNWTTDATGASTATTFANSDDAVFSAASDATGTFTITLGGTPVVGNLTVEEGTITISGGTALNVGGAVTTKGVIDVFPGSALTIISEVTGGDDFGTITKGISGGTGTGTLELTGLNTFTGQLVLMAGTLSCNSIGDVNAGASALGNPSSVANGTLKLAGINSPGATLKYTGPGHNTDRVINLSGVTGTNSIDASGSGPLVFTSPTGITATGVGLHYLRLGGTNTGENKITGVIGENGGTAARITRVEKIGPGTWVLTGVNTNSGVYDIREGTLVINSIANKGTPSSLGSGNLNNAHAVVGLGSGTNTGTLRYVGTAPAGHSSSRSITMWGATGGGTIDASGVGPLVLSGAINNFNTVGATGKLLTLKGDNSQANAISASIPNGDATTNKTSLDKDGTGKWLLNANNTYSGNTTIKLGTLSLGASASISNTPVIEVQASATFDVSLVTGGFVLGLAQTLKGNGTILGNVTANGTVSAGASVGSLTNIGNLTLGGKLVIEVDKALSPASSNDMITVTGTVTNLGIGPLTVTNLNAGVPLAAGDSFQIFNHAVTNGSALNIVSAGSVVWTNKLEVDGTIAVLSVSPPPVAATNLTIEALSPTSFNLGGLGAANSAYHVYASTNVTTPMTNWWLIGTTNSSAGGVIQFLDPQATNEQRYYRFGQ